MAAGKIAVQIPRFARLLSTDVRALATTRQLPPHPEPRPACHDLGVKLRLYHHQDGARVAYRESGTGRAIVLLHSLGLTHREWEPVTEALAARFRVVAPDLPLHGDSEDRPRHPYSPEWLADVIAGFCREAAGPGCIVAGHGFGSELALHAVCSGRLEPSRTSFTPTLEPSLVGFST